MLKIKDNLSLKDLDKYDFHKGYNQHNDNDRYYGVCKTDTLRINIETNEITCGSSLWQSMKDYYTWGGIDKLYDLIKADLIEKIEDK